MDITHLITHPEELNQETLYDLRKLVAVYPTYHAARILFLQNLFVLHDPAFDQELRRAALLVPDRRVLFTMTQSPTPHSKSHRHKKAAETSKEEVPLLHETHNADSAADVTVTTAPAAPIKTSPVVPAQAAGTRGAPKKKYVPADTTSKLLDEFLDSTPQPLPKKQIKADPSTDYMSFLMQQEVPTLADDTSAESPSALLPSADERLFSLIDSFIASQEEGISLSEDPMIPEGILDDEEEYAEAAICETIEEPVEEDSSVEQLEQLAEEQAAALEKKRVEDVSEPLTANTSTKRGVELSETLAQIYIKQQKYERAIEVLGKISTDESSTTNPYLADQIRFLQKLAHLNAKKSTKSK